MIRIVDRALPPDVAANLAAAQRDVDSATTFVERVERANDFFRRRNRKGDIAFDVVKQTLDAMCAGARRCMYCEDSAADEVEHFRPKHIYPGLVFAWINYLYACGPCNGPKNNRFQIFDANGAAIDVTPMRGRAPEAPPPGEAVLIDPRQEDPLAFLHLDLAGAFTYVPRRELNSRDTHRAEYTVSTLGLNRELVRRGRQGAFKHYAALLRSYVEERLTDVGKDRLAYWEHGIRRETGHPTVWHEMKRQRAMLGNGVAELFTAAPETLDW